MCLQRMEFAPTRDSGQRQGARSYFRPRPKPVACPRGPGSNGDTGCLGAASSHLSTWLLALSGLIGGFASAGPSTPFTAPSTGPLSAALDQAIFGHLDISVAGRLIIGSVPGAFLRTRISSRAARCDRAAGHCRPARLFRPRTVGHKQRRPGLGAGYSCGGRAGPLGSGGRALRLCEDWHAAGHYQSTWVAPMGIGTPIGLGFLASAVYAVKVRPGMLAVAGANGRQVAQRKTRWRL